MRYRPQRKKVVLIFISILFFLLFLTGWIRYQPVRDFLTTPDRYLENEFRYYTPIVDSLKPNVFVLAENAGTEMVDMMVPFYLFSLTGKANVFIIARERSPVSVFRGLGVLPHFSFHEIDSLGLRPSVIVIPYFSAHEKGVRDTVIAPWISKIYRDTVKVLSVCAGSFTAAATSLFDSRLITSHASDLQLNQEVFSRPRWTKDVTHTKDGNFYSTGGVSNAVEGSLAVIRDIFGDTVSTRIMTQIGYPYSSIKKEHRSVAFSLAEKIHVLEKVFFRQQEDIGVLLEDGIDEFRLAVILDAYHRTFPGSLHTFSVGDRVVKSRFGLSLIPTAQWKGIEELDELHRVHPPVHAALTSAVTQVDYTNTKGYIFDEALERIRLKYGVGVERATRRLLDYGL